MVSDADLAEVAAKAEALGLIEMTITRVGQALDHAPQGRALTVEEHRVTLEAVRMLDALADSMLDLRLVLAHDIPLGVRE